MTKRNYNITTDKKLKGKHKINVGNQALVNPQEAIITKEKKLWKESNPF